jgi:L-asparagine transporter-like permease
LCWSGTFLQILDYTSVGLTVISAMVVCSIFPLRRRAESAQAIRCPWHPLPALVYLGLSVWTIAFGLMDQDKFLPTLLCLVTVLAVIAMGGIFYRRKSAPPS